MPTAAHAAAIQTALDKISTSYQRQFDDPERAFALWSELLSDIAPTDIEAGARAMLQAHGRGFPTPALLRQYALQMQQARLDASAPALGGPMRDTDACPRCGATGFWWRKGMRPAWGAEGTPQYRPAEPFERCENLHEKGCPLRHPDQDEEPKPRVRIYPLSSGDADR